MNPTPFQKLVERLKGGDLNKEEFSKAWDQEVKKQKN